MASLDEDGSQDDSEADQGIRNLRHTLVKSVPGVTHDFIKKLSPFKEGWLT